ncbi:hypothetical protein CRV00_01055 [Malaciobacter molluscorum]|uniref:hypothetical protein n=1 Tax=Malaciobacter molluscorum TaxID=1032072 RepID=UPI00100BC1B0|nr:hypothetical protein [Malaciobacter molluscorum]RXJ97451.1 hypothetical protein CRV00_01055 [Malaciobacter molluscorum]
MSKRLESQCLYIQKDIENNEYVDYLFSCDIWDKDPRFKKKFMKIGEVKGLFRIDKLTYDSTLLYPMEGDSFNHCYQNALTKVLNVYNEKKQYSSKLAFHSG